jgi:hypothetical protein
MNSQNILKYFGSNLDIKLDSSEFYDYELAKTELDYDFQVIDFENEITYDSLIIDSSCLSGGDVNSIKPWEIPINENYTGDTCDFTVRRRTEKGWTLDFIFNRENIAWSGGSTFYYWGITNETDPLNYLDNNLSFSFTDDGRVKWEKYHFSGYCHTTSGYTETSYIATGQTNILCSGGTSADFNITITFTRNNTYENCFIYNEGGSNDYITGWTVTNPIDTITGATEEYEIIEVLNKRWAKERNKRLGTLKIYLNGVKIYKIDNWEEIIPSARSSGNTISQIWGGGTSGVTDLHTGTTLFNLKQVKYFEKPLNYLNIKHHYLVTNKVNYNIVECGEDCVDNLSFYTNSAILTELSDYLFTENDNFLEY